MRENNGKIEHKKNEAGIANEMRKKMWIEFLARFPFGLMPEAVEASERARALPLAAHFILTI